MTTTYKHTVYKAENDKGVIELNTEAKPTKEDYTKHGTYYPVQYNLAVKIWNANTIKAEVSDELNQFLGIELYKIWQHTPDENSLSYTFEGAKQQGINILSLMGRIDVKEGCGECSWCVQLHKEGDQFCAPIATLNPVVENMPEEKQTQEGDHIEINDLTKDQVRKLESAKHLVINGFDFVSKMYAVELCEKFAAAQSLRVAELEKLIDKIYEITDETEVWRMIEKFKGYTS